MNRRDFFRRSAAIVAAAAVMDPLELIDRLQPRRLFPSVALDGFESWNLGTIDVLQHGSFAFIQTNQRFSLDGWVAGYPRDGGRFSFLEPGHRIIEVDRQQNTITLETGLPPISADDTIYFGQKRRRRRRA